MVDPQALLRLHPYFSALPAKALRDVSLHVVVRSYKKGTLIFSEGEPSQGLYLVESGVVRVFKSSEDGKEQVLHHVTPGQSFNDVATFDGGPCPANAEAAERATLLLVPRKDLLNLLRAHPELALTVIKVLSGRLRQMGSLVEDLALRHVVSRVAHALLRASKGSATATLPSKHELASMVGSVREVVTRALKQLDRQGAIRLGPRRTVSLLNRELLHRLSGAPSSSPRQPRPRGVS